MSAFDTPWFNAQDKSFFNSLNKSKLAHVILCAETEDFADEVSQEWRETGFDVHYVPLLDGGNDFIKRVHTLGDQLGVGEQYAIVAFGDAAGLVLEGHTKPSSPRLISIIAYYPTAIPPPSTQYPASVRVLVHLAGKEVDIRRNPEVLGIQSSKKKTITRRIDPGAGHGECLKLGFKAYTYSACEPGFAEHDLDEFDAVAESLAFSRSVGVVKRAFRVEDELELVRDDMVDSAAMGTVKETMKHIGPFARVIHAPTLVGGVGSQQLETFYTNLFHPLPKDFTTRLLSRTNSADRVVDELFVTFTHNVAVPWMLPGMPATNHRVEIIVVCIVNIRSRQLESEHVYWDQASVLAQVGLLDPKLAVPEQWRKKGVKKLPIVGAEGSRAIKRGSSRQLNALTQGGN